MDNISWPAGNNLLCFDSDLESMFNDSTPSNSQEEPKVKVEIVMSGDPILPLSPGPYSPNADNSPAPSSSSEELNHDETSMDLGATLRDLGIAIEDEVPSYMGENEETNQALAELLQSVGLPGGDSEATQIENVAYSIAPASSGPQFDDAAIPADQILLLNQVGISEDELVNLPVKELNRRVAGLDKEDQKKLKARRRTLKNRGYAQICRTKRIISNEQLVEENKDLRIQLANIMKERDALMRQVKYCKGNH